MNGNTFYDRFSGILLFHKYIKARSVFIQFFTYGSILFFPVILLTKYIDSTIFTASLQNGKCSDFCVTAALKYFPSLDFTVPSFTESNTMSKKRQNFAVPFAFESISS